MNTIQSENNDLGLKIEIRMKACSTTITHVNDLEENLGFYQSMPLIL